MNDEQLIDEALSKYLRVLQNTLWDSRNPLNVETKKARKEKVNEIKSLIERRKSEGNR